VNDPLYEIGQQVVSYHGKEWPLKIIRIESNMYESNKHNYILEFIKVPPRIYPTINMWEDLMIEYNPLPVHPTTAKDIAALLV